MHAYLPISDACWTYTDTLRFHLPPVESSRLYTFSVGIRANDRPSYRDLWVVVEQRTSGMCRRDTTHLFLASDRGAWHSPGVVLHDIEQVVAAARYEQGEEADILLYHIMSSQEVDGIVEAGIKVE